MPLRRPLALLALVLLAGCSQIDGLRQALGPSSPHERYRAMLDEGGLAHTVLGRAWTEAAEEALQAPALSPLPFEEAVFFSGALPEAAGLAFEVPRGARLTVRVTATPADSGRVFVDLFRLPDEGSAERAPQRVETLREPFPGPTGEATITHEPRADERLVLRIQPELLRDGRVRVEATTEGSLGFPVAGAVSRDIGSVFGDPRDGGARRHEGVDVFAPRGRPVVAVSAGTVTRVGESGLGGKTVWVRDDARPYSYYYAHLDTQLAEPGQRVAAGDTLGTVGNTGNARTTPPHLHFGIYGGGRGAVDPSPFIDTARREPPPLRADTSALGEWARLTSASSLEGLSADGERLPTGRVVRVVGASGDRYRVALPGGGGGHLAARLIASTALREETLAEASALFARPSEASALADTLAAGSRLEVLGTAEGFRLVRTTGGRLGWLPS